MKTTVAPETTGPSGPASGAMLGFWSDLTALAAAQTSSMLRVGWLGAPGVFFLSPPFWVNLLANGGASSRSQTPET